MADTDNQYSYDEPPVDAPSARRGVDLPTLVFGIAALLVSVYTLSDGSSWLPQFDIRWVLAGGAVLVGVMMLGASVRGDRRP